MFIEGTSLQGKGKLRETSVDPFNMAAETLQCELAQRKEPSRAQVEVQKFFHNVKETSEAAIIKAGEKVGIDLTATSNHPPMSSISGSPSNGSLATMNTGDNNNNNNNNRMNGGYGAQGGGGGGFPFQQQQGGYGNNTGPLQYDDQTSTNHIPSFRSTAAAATAASKLFPGQNSSGNTLASSQGGRSPSPYQSPTPKTYESAEDTKTSQEKWEAELERVKKEKKWEQEIERIKRERQQRAVEEEELAKHPELRHRPEAAPVVDTGCKMGCVLS
jgi:hypothetical protein